MYKDLAWNQFMKTGNIETYMEYKKIEALRDMIDDNKKGGITDETYQSERNSNKRSSL